MRSGSGTGSGEVIRSAAYVLTSNHVISVAAASDGSVMVLFADGQTAPATITGRDPQTDLAVLHVVLPVRRCRCTPRLATRRVRDGDCP
jgi:putative serine protease PepD